MEHHHLENNAPKFRSAPINRRWLRRDAMRGRYSADYRGDKKLDTGFSASNNLYPSLFHSWPLRAGRIDKTVRALQRVERRRQFTLPVRSDYQSTADLYEAALPILKTLSRLGGDIKSIAPVHSISIRGMLHDLKSHLYF